MMVDPKTKSFHPQSVNLLICLTVRIVKKQLVIRSYTDPVKYKVLFGDLASGELQARSMLQKLLIVL